MRGMIEAVGQWGFSEAPVRDVARAHRSSYFSEILDEIVNPSRIIKPSMMAVRVFKTNGQTMLGRVVNAGEKTISLMLIGNQVVEIPRHEILKTENEKKSLMYEGLTNGLEEPQRGMFA